MSDKDLLDDIAYAVSELQRAARSGGNREAAFELFVDRYELERAREALYAMLDPIDDELCK